MSETPGLFADVRDLLDAFEEEGVRFVIVGAHALAAHGVPRATGDFDVLVAPTAANAELVVRALRTFGAPLAAHGVEVDDFARPGAVYQLGLPPRRIDVLTSISGVTFDDAYEGLVRATVDGRKLPVLGRETLIRNKRATGRAKDMLDADALERIG